MSKITFTNKVDSLINSAPAINKIVAADMNEIKTSVNALYDAAHPYKIYTALLNQSGTSAPVATVLENTLGVNILNVRLTNGTYYITADLGIFLLAKTFVIVGNKYFSQINAVVSGGYFLLDDCIEIITRNTSNAPVDGVLFYTPIEIRVYN